MKHEGFKLIEAACVLYIAGIVVITREIWSKWYESYNP